MNSQRVLIFFFALLIALPSVSAITIETVPIGNPGNAADVRYRDSDPFHPNGVGSVAYQYRMQKTEVSNTQYVAFLNAVASADPYGLYSARMESEPGGGIVRSGVSGNFSYTVKTAAIGGAYSYEDKPVTYVSAGDAMRFANWLHNRQPTGPQNANTTEDGAYTVNGATTDAALAAVTRNATARWWLPNEDEWYKAAYHKNDGVTGDYWDYPTGTSSTPNNNLPSNDSGNSANFYNSGYTTGNSSYPLTDVGAYALSTSPYGTFDQGGNVGEWNETPLRGGRGIHGGSSLNVDYVMKFYYYSAAPATDDFEVGGFRVASIPEPSAIYFAVVSVLALTSRRLSFDDRQRSLIPDGQLAKLILRNSA